MQALDSCFIWLPLRYLWKTAVVFPEVSKEECFPDGKKVVFCCCKFEAQSDQRIILIPSAKLMKDDLPEPFLHGSDVVQCPVVYLPIIKYCAFLKGVKECFEHGFLET